MALPFSLMALPVELGEIEVGLDSYDGYQEANAYISTNESGTAMDIVLRYRGFGLDTVTWRFGEQDFLAIRETCASAAWWRSRLLEMTIRQTVLKEAAVTTPDVEYVYRSGNYTFEGSEHLLQFLRQGKDYALVLSDKTPGVETRRSGERILPAFTLHFPGKHLPQLRDMLSESNLSRVLADYAAQKALIDAILAEGPEQGPEHALEPEKINH